MNTELSVCGVNCTECNYFKKSECQGCSAIRGKVWWAGYVNAEVCPIYNCVINEKKYGNCGECGDLPCKIWQDLKDPNFSDEEHEAGIRARIENLMKE